MSNDTKTLKDNSMSEEKMHILRFRVPVDYASILDDINFDDALSVLAKTIEQDREAISIKMSKKPADFIDFVIMSKAEPYGHDGGIEQELLVYGLENDKEHKARMQTVIAERLRVEALAEKQRVAKAARNQDAIKKALKDAEVRRNLYLELQKEFSTDSGPGAWSN